MDSHDESRAFHPHAVSISGSLSQRLLRLAKTPHSARPTRLGKSNADPRNSSHPCPEPANVWESTHSGGTPQTRTRLRSQPRRPDHARDGPLRPPEGPLLRTHHG